MDGDRAPLAEIRALADEFDAVLLVDEAHAIGVWGHGGGLCRQLGDPARPDLLVGTLGKALGSLGGFIVCAGRWREFLVNRARSFIYATALAPACVGAALGAVEVIERDRAMGERLLEQSRGFHRMLREQGLDLPELNRRLFRLRVGRNEQAVQLAECLRQEGVLVTAIRPPTVPAGTARLRLSVTLAHGEDALTWAAEKTDMRPARWEVYEPPACGYSSDSRLGRNGAGVGSLSSRVPGSALFAPDVERLLDEWTASGSEGA
jgi:7-keto-8-aminopelargonate synthetase-like enzyme